MSATETVRRPATARPEKTSRREIANFNERRRMKSINDGFDSLKDLLPADKDKFSKAAILQHANDYIKFLIHRNKELTKEVTTIRSGAMVQTLPMMPFAYQFPAGSAVATTTVSPKERCQSSPTPSPSPGPSLVQSSVKVTTKRRRPTTTKKARSSAANKARTKPSQSKLDLMLAAIDTLERSGDSDARSVDSADSNSDSEHHYGFYREMPVVATPSTAMVWNENQKAIPIQVETTNAISRRLQLD